MLLLLSNDDGIDAPGLHALEAALAPVGDVVVVAPATEQSAKSHALTMHEPLRVDARGNRRFAVSGTPADSVYLGVHRLCGGRPDVVVSGINRGTNLGDDVHYSGTVAAAREGALQGIPAVAVSLQVDGKQPGGPRHWGTAGEAVRRIVEEVLRNGLPPGCFLNLNVPDVARLPGVRAVSLGRRLYEPLVQENRDPRGRAYYWIGGGHLAFCDEPGTDGHAFSRGFATVTPLQPDFTHRDALRALEGWSLE